MHLEINMYRDGGTTCYDNGERPFILTTPLDPPRQFFWGDNANLLDEPVTDRCELGDIMHILKTANNTEGYDMVSIAKAISCLEQIMAEL